MKKTYFIAIFIILIGILSFFLWPKRSEEKTVFSPIAKRGVDISTGSSSIITTDRKPQTEEIIYTDAGFNPTVLTIFSGDTIIFKNKSSKSFQPVDDIKNKNTFGATTTISKKGQYQFTFTKKGEYGYYDFLNQNMFGAIIVR